MHAEKETIRFCTQRSHSFANDMKAVSETLRGRTGGDFVGLAKMADCDVGDGGLCWATRWRVLMG